MSSKVIAVQNPSVKQCRRWHCCLSDRTSKYHDFIRCQHRQCKEDHHSKRAEQLHFSEEELQREVEKKKLVGVFRNLPMEDCSREHVCQFSDQCECWHIDMCRHTSCRAVHHRKNPDNLHYSPEEWQKEADKYRRKYSLLLF